MATVFVGYIFAVILTLILTLFSSLLSPSPPKATNPDKSQQISTMVNWGAMRAVAWVVAAGVVVVALAVYCPMQVQLYRWARRDQQDQLQQTAADPQQTITGKIGGCTPYSLILCGGGHFPDTMCTRAEPAALYKAIAPAAPRKSNGCKQVTEVWRPQVFVLQELEIAQRPGVDWVFVVPIVNSFAHSKVPAHKEKSYQAPAIEIHLCFASLAFVPIVVAFEKELCNRFIPRGHMWAQRDIQTLAYIGKIAARR
ncbi:predicted protein [Uncinocarpus reesii 1704]|uniref:Uncharacterized protein n=1 Tax=Uncinocarpus reesii (strain UAMH 1704) TaxID=336963 RepID=C4JQ52_UNCRE|nr:uncharacterized protein UREG_03285 [Uncinocarpus reesii 1704]EEP78439.1 predicted protein [Uncinocarpus reesii 1704]